MHVEPLTGRVLRYRSGFFTVHTEVEMFTCQLRGRLKRGPARGDLVAVGDLVVFSPIGVRQGVIEEVCPRTSELARLAPTPRGVYRQVLLANIDQIVIVFACAQPEPHLRMLDRFLVICEKQHIPPLIIANKVDLTGLPVAQLIFDRYTPLGYDVLFASTLNGEGIDALRLRLSGKVSGLVGPSGVGKSSLLNAVQPELGLKVSRISEITEKGRHTTAVREMFILSGGGYVADLPGLRSLALWDTYPEELDGYFPELRDLVAYCQFGDCTHRDEPGCAVRTAVSDGRVHMERYTSYLRMRFGDEER